MSKVLFGQSYYLGFDPKLHRLMQPYPPLGTLIAAARLRDQGHDVALFDAMLAESEADWATALDREQPRVAILFEDNFNYLSKMCLLRMRRAAFTMLASAKSRGCTVLVCGSDASDRPGEYLAHGADVVLVGEGEETLSAVMDHFRHHGEAQLAEIAGLAYTDLATGEVKRTAPRPVMRNLDALPFPAWDLVDVERYRALWQRHHGHYAMNMVTTRGCPFHCNWCAKPIWGQTYHVRDPAIVAAELAWLKSTYHPDRVWFADDILGLRRGWMMRFADELDRRQGHVPFKCQSRVDLLLREGEIEAFRRAGAHTVWVGAESGSQRILDAMDKGTRVEQIVEATRRMHDAGIRVGFFLQFGYPGESRDDIEQTRRMVRDCRPDEIGMSVSYPLPGTVFHERVKEELGVKQNWVDSDDLDMMFAGTYTTGFYRQLYRVLHKEFRARSAARLLRDALGSPARFDRANLRLAGAALYHGATLPIARLRMERLMRRSSRAVTSLRQTMTPAEAAEPTPQEVE